MKTFLTKITLGLCLLLGFIAFYSPIANAVYNPFQTCQNTTDNCQNVCSSGSSGSGSTVCQDSNTQNDSTTDPVYHTIQVAANIIALIGGIVAVITIMISGLNYVTSSGEQEKIKNAKTRITGAIIGLVILALTYTITTFGVNLIK